MELLKNFCCGLIFLLAVFILIFGTVSIGNWIETLSVTTQVVIAYSVTGFLVFGLVVVLGQLNRFLD